MLKRGTSRPARPVLYGVEQDKVHHAVNCSQHNVSTKIFPWNNCYYDANNMNGSHIRCLIEHDTLYDEFRQEMPPQLDAITVVDGQVEIASKPLNVWSDAAWVQQTSNPKTIKIASVFQRRQFCYDWTANLVGLRSAEEWEKLLGSLEVLPSWIELLHSNNGGVFSYTSYDSAAEGGLPAYYHLGVKIGVWKSNEHNIYGHEHAIYARIPLADDSSPCVLLLMGTDVHSYADFIRSRLALSCEDGIFHIIFHLVMLWRREVEQSRWQLDHQVQRQESQTGYCSLRLDLDSPKLQTTEELKLDPQLYATADYLNKVVRGSCMVNQALKFLKEQLVAFNELCDTTADFGQIAKQQQLHCKRRQRLSLPVTRQLLSALDQQISLASGLREQVQELKSRVDVQISVTRTLIAQRDAQNGIQVAHSTKRDSELMRGIATVTMIFLPATFVATFFSMVFFDVGEEIQRDGTKQSRALNFQIDERIWLYPVVTLSLTLVICIWYSGMTTGIWKALRAFAGGLVHFSTWRDLTHRISGSKNLARDKSSQEEKATGG